MFLFRRFLCFMFFFQQIFSASPILDCLESIRRPVSEASRDVSVWSWDHLLQRNSPTARALEMARNVSDERQRKPDLGSIFFLMVPVRNPAKNTRLRYWSSIHPIIYGPGKLAPWKNWKVVGNGIFWTINSRFWSSVDWQWLFCLFVFKREFWGIVSKMNDTVDGWNPKQPPGMYETL